MNYYNKTKTGFVVAKEVVKLYDIVQIRVGYWKNKISIITAIKDQHIHIRIIENGIDMCFKVKDLVFINHNNKTAAKSYFELCEKMHNQFISKYSNINYIKEHFDDDSLICNDIVARTICEGAGIYISSNPDKYNVLAINWLAEHKELISAIIRIGDISLLMEKTHKEEINDIGYNNYIKLIKFFYGKD